MRTAAALASATCLLLAGGPSPGLADDGASAVASATQLRPPIGPASRPPRAVFFGSSTTAGTGASRPGNRWSARVASALGWIEVNRGLPGSKLAARDGEQVASAEARLREVIGEAPEVVVVMYGANDAAAGLILGDHSSAGTFHHAAAAVLRRLRDELPGALLVVCTPQPAVALGPSRSGYDAVLELEARRVGAVFVETHRAFGPERFATLTSDAIHLNDGGHAAVGEFVADAVARAIGPVAVDY